MQLCDIILKSQGGHMKNLVIKKCLKCGALVEVLQDCNCKDCGINCCGQQMTQLKPNSVDASFEKHVPTYTKKCGKINAMVNHVMDDDHYIEWIAFLTDNNFTKVEFNPGEKPEAKFNYAKGTLYAYCNKHGLWSKDVE